MSILERLRQSLQTVLGGYEFKADESVVLTGYYVICEWSTADGEKWLTRTTGDLNDQGPPDWTVKGWLGFAQEAHAYSPDDS